MILSFNGNGDIETLVPSRVYQGSNNASSFSVVAPFGEPNAVTIKFTLPDGSVAEPLPMVGGNEFYNGLFIWTLNIDVSITKYAGQVNFQIEVQNTNGEIVATGSSYFVVEKGVAVNLPDVPDASTYQTIISQLSNLYSQKVDRIDVYNVPENIIFNLDGYKMPNILYYNKPENWAILVVQAVGEDSANINQYEFKFNDYLYSRTLTITNDKMHDVVSASEWLPINQSIINGLLAPINQNVAENTSNISSLTTRVSTAETNISANTQKINENTANISSNTTKITANTNQIAQNTQDISQNTQDISYLKNNISTGENYVGTLTVSTLPTNEELNDFVQSVESRQPQNGDVVIVVLDIPNETNKNYKYFNSASNWNSYEIPPMEEAQNGTLGIVKGNYVQGNENSTQIDIVGGEVKNIYLKLTTDNSELTNLITILTNYYSSLSQLSQTIDTLSTSLQETKSDVSANSASIETNTNSINSINNTVGDILSGATIVPKANLTTNDQYGNNISSTYQTKAEGATKSYVREYSLPRTFNDVFYVTSSGYSTEVPTTPSTEIQFTATVNSVAYTTLAEITKTETAEYELSRKNSYSNSFYISANQNVTGLSLILTTSYKKIGEETSTTINVQTVVQSLSADAITRIDFEDFMTSLGNNVINVGEGDEIIQILELQQLDSTETTYSLYSGETYPSTFNLNTNAQVSKGTNPEDLIITSMDFEPVGGTLVYADNKAEVLGDYTIHTQDGNQYNADGKISIPMQAGNGIVLDADETNSNVLISLEDNVQSILNIKDFDVNATYSKGEVVNYYSRIVISKIDNNKGNYPTLQTTDTNWLFLSFYSEQLPITQVSSKLYLTGTSSSTTSGNEAIYKNGNCYIFQDVLYDKNGAVINKSTLIPSGGGFNGGENSSATFGGSIGRDAYTEYGGSVGNGSSSTQGGAVGRNAKTSLGFAGGFTARAVDENGDGINAIQLGTGTNTKPKTLKIYGDNIYDANTHTLTVTGNITNGENEISVRDIVVNIQKTLTGTIIAYAGTTAPDGYLMCDGSAISRTTYSALFNVIGTSFGSGDGSTTFNLPNLMGRFLQGGSTIKPYVEPSLPNIKGNTGLQGARTPTGAFLNSETASYAGTAQYAGHYISFDASRYNSIYKDNVNTVQPPAVVMPYIIKY